MLSARSRPGQGCPGRLFPLLSARNLPPAVFAFRMAHPRRWP